MSHKKDLNLSDDVKKQCHAIIHSAATMAGATGTGLAQIPLSDNAVIVPIQVTMIITLGKKVFGRDISESVAKGIISSAAASFVGRGVSQVALGWIPGLGNVVNTATAAGLTEAIGWLAVKEFSTKATGSEVTDEDTAPEQSKNDETIRTEREADEQTEGGEGTTDKDLADVFEEKL